MTREILPSEWPKYEVPSLAQTLFSPWGDVIGGQAIHGRMCASWHAVDSDISASFTRQPLNGRQPGAIRVPQLSR